MADVSDKPEILALYRSAVGRPGCTWDDAYPSEALADGDIAAGKLYVLADDGHIIGAVSVVRENELDGIDCWELRGGSCREIARIAISAAYSGRRLSAVMLEQLFEVLRGEGCVSVHILVSPHNIPARRIYERLGFTFCSRYEMFGHEFIAAEKIL